jgi:imidazolonepropionase
MSGIVIENIGQLLNVRTHTAPLKGAQLRELPAIHNAFLITEDDRIAAFGKMEDLPAGIRDGRSVVDAKGGMVLPAWCDSHTHIVYPQGREEEFVDKIRGASYAEIAAKGGGILNSARALAEMPEDRLYEESLDRLKRAARLGTGAIEIKSGYGLTLEGELKMLRVIRRLKENSRITIRSTFLAAHALPPEYRNNREEYIRVIIEDMLPVVAGEKLADFVDVFCEQGFFSNEECEKICRASKDFGLIPKIHANQLSASGAVQTAIRVGAISADHLEHMDDAAIEALAASDTVGTLLPTAAFFLRMPLQNARAMIDNGCAIALASDCNPGSSPGFNMNFVVSLSCIQMRMLPEEAINAATINGAFAMNVEQECGSITVGKKANLIFTGPLRSIAYLPYSFSEPLVQQVMIGGEFI